MPRVSVLLTSYNHAAYLPEALACLRAQTFRDFEVLALDDGSTDGSREYLAQQPDVECHFHPKNLGTYGNLNFGIEHSRGEYIAVFNDDDVWGPEKLAKQVEVLDQNPNVALVHTSGWFIGPRGEKVEGAPLGFPWPETENGDILASLMDYNKIITSSAMFRRAVLDQTGPFDPSFYGCGDWHLWLRIAEVAEVVHLKEPLTFYRVHPEQACRDVDKMNEDSLRIREWMASREQHLLGLQRQRGSLRPAVTHNWACLGSEYMWRGRAAEARAAYGASLRLNPLRFKSVARWVASFLPPRVFRRLN